MLFFYSRYIFYCKIKELSVKRLFKFSGLCQTGEWRQQHSRHCSPAFLLYVLLVKYTQRPSCTYSVQEPTQIFQLLHEEHL